MKRQKVAIIVAAIAAAVVIILAVLMNAPTKPGDIHYYHQDLTQEDAQAGRGFNYGPSDEHLSKAVWEVSFEKRLSKDTSLLADWYFLLVKDEDIKTSAEHGNQLEPELVKDAELREKTYAEVKNKLDGATIETLKWQPGTQYLTGIMKPEAPTKDVPVLDSKTITTETNLTVMAIYANPSKTGDGEITAYCVPGCGDQPAELLGGGSGGSGGGSYDPYNPHRPTPPDPPTGCSDTQTWEPSYGQQAEKYTDSKTGGGNSHMNTEDPPVSGTTRIDQDPRIDQGWTTQPDVPTTPPEVSGGSGRVSGDD